jgi:hypothetical protein
VIFSTADGSELSVRHIGISATDAPASRIFDRKTMITFFQHFLVGRQSDRPAPVRFRSAQSGLPLHQRYPHPLLGTKPTAAGYAAALAITAASVEQCAEVGDAMKG